MVCKQAHIQYRTRFYLLRQLMFVGDPTRDCGLATQHDRSAFWFPSTPVQSCHIYQRPCLQPRGVEANSRFLRYDLARRAEDPPLHSLFATPQLDPCVSPSPLSREERHQQHQSDAHQATAHVFRGRQRRNYEGLAPTGARRRWDRERKMPFSRQKNQCARPSTSCPHFPTAPFPQP